MPCEKALSIAQNSSSKGQQALVYDRFLCDGETNDERHLKLHERHIFILGFSFDSKKLPINQREARWSVNVIRRLFILAVSK